MNSLPEAEPAMREFAMNYESKLNNFEMLTNEIMSTVSQTAGIR